MKVKIILIIVISVLTVYLSTQTDHKYKRKIPNIDPVARYKVTKILDGDTIQVKIGKEIYTIRMLGIDTPETVDPRKKPQCYGKEASDKTKELLTGYSVTIKTDSTQNILDKFGRILAYIDREDGLSINQYLLQNGYAREYTYDKKYEKQNTFKTLETNAKEEKLGLWSLFCLKK